jgi:hypothetical protein
MEVERLIVLVLSATGGSHGHSPLVQAGDQRDGLALAGRFLSKRTGKVEEAWEKIANGAGQEIAGYGAAQIGKHSAIVVHYLDGKPRTASLQDIATFLKDAASCGIYIVMHGLDGMISPSTKAAEKCLSPKSVAQEVNKLCPQKIKLLKVNIVGCTLARSPGGDHGSQKLRAKLVKAGSWAQAFCQELKRKETMVASYTEAVYVVRDNNTELNASVDGLSGESLRPQGSQLGQKAVESSPDAKIDTVAAHRTKVKKVFQYDGSKVAPVDLKQYQTWKG